ncbi:MAG: hypothetical protein M0T74_15800 [Desulfitobacterium hafniense]|nr:hypothetical protein [Desulfitobacterium hafniense]
MSYMGPSVGLGIFSFLGLVIYLGFLALVVYLIISTIQFFKRKIENDKELLVKLDTLIQIQSQKKDIQS